MKKFSKQEYVTIWEVCSKREEYGTWDDVAKVLNQRLNTTYDESAFRKAYQYWNLMNEAIKDCIGDDSDVAMELQIQKRELERAKIQFRDERNAWNRQNYNNARVEQKLDYLEKVIKDKSVGSFNHKPVPKSNKSIIACCSDWHIGECFDNEYGVYNSDIAKQRLERYANEVYSLCVDKEITNVIVLGLGDSISGSIHRTVQVTNRENVIEQITLASELMKEFCNFFLDSGLNVTFMNVAGNHSRLTSKDDAIKDERFDNLIGWYTNSHLCASPNFTYIKTPETNLGEFELYGKKYIACHGDYDRFSESGLSNLVLAKGYKPAAMFFGHYHTMAVDDLYDVKLIRSGCLSGSGNDYTQQKRLKSKPSQTVVVADEYGINEFYNITLD